MIGALRDFGRRGLFMFDPETAHGMSIAALRSGLVPACRISNDSRLRQTVAGLISPIRSAWPRATTRMPKCRRRC